MNIVIENIALVKKAEIELNGITVVAGLNKTGKTTIGKAMYAIISAYRDLPLRILNSRRNGIGDAFVGIMRANKELLANTSLWIGEIEEDFVEPIKDRDLVEWAAGKEYKSVRAYIDRWIHSKREYEEYIRKEDAYAIYNVICAILERPDEEYEKFLIESFIRNVFNKQINCFYNDEKGEIMLSFSDYKLETEFTGNELSHFSQYNVSDTRAIYMESMNLLDLLQSGGRARRTSRGWIAGVSRPADDCIRLLNRIANEDEESYEEYTESKKVREIIEYIVGKVTHGSLKNDSSGISFVDNKGQKPVELSNLSAGLKVFVVIQTLLENGSLKRGDILLIDEPEVNLHPEWQVVLAEILVLLRKELGIVLYINSHSPYFIRAIEVKLAQNEMTLEGKFYLTVPQEDLYHVEDVTQETERIYELLYKPLEKL